MEIWVTEGQNGYTVYEPNLDALDETPINLVVHYERENQDYDNFRCTLGEQVMTHIKTLITMIRTGRQNYFH